LLEVNATEKPEDAEAPDRPPQDLALVVDRSSSMVGSRITYAIEAVSAIASGLTEHDRLVVVAFDADVVVALEPGPVGPDTSRQIADSLTRLGLGYGTNLEAGWRTAAKLLTSGGLVRASKTILMLTDGYPSKGVKEAETLAALTESGCKDGLVTHVVGIGEKFNEDLLAAMAESGGGIFQFAQYDHDIGHLSSDPVLAAKSVAAQESNLQVEFDAGITRYELVHKLPCALKDEVLFIELGALYYSTHRSILLELYSDEPLNEAGKVRLWYQAGADIHADLEGHTIQVEDSPQAAERAGEVLVPLLAFRYLKSLWRHGNDYGVEKVKAKAEELMRRLAALPQSLRSGPQAQQALQDFAETCKILESMDAGSVFGKEITSVVSRVETGIKSLKGWGRK